jgi:hypothetical protein
MVDVIFAFRQKIGKRWEFDEETCLSFIDVEKAHNNINRSKSWEVFGQMFAMD